MVAIRVRGLGKSYRLGQGILHSTLRERLTELCRVGRSPGSVGREFWALRGVDFDVEPGTVVGLIGRNGAGKSTLLRVLSRITEPTEGEAVLIGRTASLLEVGTGFHGELTGRENVLMSAAILGMPRATIRRRFDDIVEFAGVQEFLETPVKRYSSGMYVRLAFAVAAHLDPDILFVDEVLAVGDAAFQRKCLKKMDGLREEGRTVVLVSHNMGTISSLCHRAIWLEGGVLLADGKTGEVISKYLESTADGSSAWTPTDETGPLQYHVVRLLGASGGGVVSGDEAAVIEMDFSVVADLPPGAVYVRLTREDGTVILTSSIHDGKTESRAEWTKGRQVWRCSVPGTLLAPGRYFVGVSHPIGEGNYFKDAVLSFVVSEHNSLAARDGRVGVICPRLGWERA